MIANRFAKAIAMQEGGPVNLVALSAELQIATLEAQKEGAQPSEDPAVRLILHHLASIANASEFDRDSMAYQKMMDRCRVAASSPAGTPIRVWAVSVVDANSGLPQCYNISVRADSHKEVVAILSDLDSLATRAEVVNPAGLLISHENEAMIDYTLPKDADAFRDRLVDLERVAVVRMPAEAPH